LNTFLNYPEPKKEINLPKNSQIFKKNTLLLLGNPPEYTAKIYFSSKKMDKIIINNFKKYNKL
jgi:hypothetical protein